MAAYLAKAGVKCVVLEGALFPPQFQPKRALLPVGGAIVRTVDGALDFPVGRLFERVGDGEAGNGALMRRKSGDDPVDQVGR